ncbi:MAG TPA: tripartite tricarboxylate transporter substrate binding protein, partial [Burkholderiales bacterium]
MRALLALFAVVLLVANAAAQTHSTGSEPALSLPKGQAYPTRPVRIVIPLSPGGTTDVPGRIIAQKLSESLGQQFFVENRA